MNASQEDEGTYKCAAYNPVTQEVKTSGSSDRLRVRRKEQGSVSLMEGAGRAEEGADSGWAQAVLQVCGFCSGDGSQGAWASGASRTQMERGSLTAGSQPPAGPCLALGVAVLAGPFLLPFESFPSLWDFLSRDPLGCVCRDSAQQLTACVQER